MGCGPQAGSSAYRPILSVIADIPSQRLGAITGCEQLQQSASLFDHLVGDREQVVGYFDVQCPGSLGIDD
jgi:hypothetical protein